MLLLPLALWPAAGRAADPKPGPPLSIHRAPGPITLDGDLSDPGWQGAEKITTWFETNVGDNVEPQVKNVGYLTYDDQYFYAGFEFEDPDPKAIRAPIGDRDALGSPTDYAGVIIDSRDDGKTAQMFLANPNGTLYDALTSDASGEDSSPDFYWDAAGKITTTGWTLEIRIPFSSLRYSQGESGPGRIPTWGILLYRNYPRDRRYQFFSAKLPRDVNCFICNESKLSGLRDLPHGSHLVVVPYATAARDAAPQGDPGTPLANQGTKIEGGLDLKWSPNADTAVDLAVNPDFSQIESDTAQISANERFALFYAEKRPFFLEGVDLFSTPIQALYTRTVTSPRDGLRITGKIGGTAYTALVAEDRGGGLVVLPGPQDSGFAEQDFSSKVGVVRMKHDYGASFVSFLATTREIDGGGHNRVFGPDFQWRPKPSDSITGQFLWSDSLTPNRPDLAPQWDGRQLDDHAWKLGWSHGTAKVDWLLQATDIGSDFRADNGFVPQVGYREAYLDAGYTIRPQDNFVSRWRLFTTDYYDRGPSGELLARRVSVGAGADGKLNSFLRVELNRDDFEVGTKLLQRFRPRLYLELIPGRVVNDVWVEVFLGDEIDFANAREGRGATLTASMSLRPSDHLELALRASRRWIDETAAGVSGRLFTAQVERLRATWSFSSRAFVRLIGQYVETRRDPSLYLAAVSSKDASFTTSALFAYKLNWQTVLFFGWGDDREYLPLTDQLEPSSRQIFLKVSYAWQR